LLQALSSFFNAQQDEQDNGSYAGQIDNKGKNYSRSAWNPAFASFLVGAGCLTVAA
jgi:hypothetical protein